GAERDPGGGRRQPHEQGKAHPGGAGRRVGAGRRTRGGEAGAATETLDRPVRRSTAGRIRPARRTNRGRGGHGRVPSFAGNVSTCDLDDTLSPGGDASTKKTRSTPPEQAQAWKCR